MTFTHALSTDNYGPAKFIVSALPYEGTHTTIAAAIAAASSGDTIFIRPGTYTENLTGKAGVNITAYNGDKDVQTVTIIGTISYSSAGNFAISNCYLQTNGSNILSVTGSDASVVTLNNCFLNMTNATGINYTTSNASSSVTINQCFGNVGTTGITFFTSTSTGSLNLQNLNISNSGNSTTASTISTGTLNCSYSSISVPISMSGTALGTLHDNVIDTAGTNTTALTLNVAGSITCFNNTYRSGTATALVVTAGQFDGTKETFKCTNTNAVSGAGTFKYNNINFSDTGIGLAATTNTLGISSCFQKVVQQVFTSASSTYTPTQGMKYCIVQCLAGGGAGGGAQATAGSTVSVGGGGGAGEYAEGVFTAAQVGASQTATVGAGGTGASGAAGNAGGTSSLGALITCGGGNGGGSGGAGTTSFANEGSGGSGGSGGSFRAVGMRGMYGYALSNLLPGPQGANSQFGSGGKSSLGGSFGGSNASNYGAGGGGAINGNSQAARSGGNGSQGIIIITEFV